MTRSSTLALLRLSLVAGLVALPACGATPGPDYPAGPRILFIGNSLTYEDSLGARVADVLAQFGDSAVYVRTVGFPDYSLEDHWNEGTAPRLLREERWDFVVMQQGPSSTPENQLYLASWVKQFAPLIRAAGAEPVLFQVWPSLRDTARFALVDQSYRAAADSVGGLYAPAGNAWHHLLGADYPLGAALYEVDAFHPTPMGTYLAAVVIAARIRGMQPDHLPAVAPGLPLPTGTVRALQRAAQWALDHAPAHP